ncbi:MAG: MFS transporter [Cyanobacteriota bacterium]|nr:MFS transporter [Cyanobacteriota bacterium]
MTPDPAPGLVLAWLRHHQREIFLLASGLSSIGSFAGLTAKGWILFEGTGDPLLLALHFASLSLPSLLVSGAAGVLTDRIGCEWVLIRSQWALLGCASLAALVMTLPQGHIQVAGILLSTLLGGVASTYELTARNKYTALLVDRPEDLPPYLTSFSIVFNVGKLLGPPLGGWLLALTGPTVALVIDAATFLGPIATIIWVLQPQRSWELPSPGGANITLKGAWRDCGPVLRHVIRFTGLACLVGFFHPGLAPVMASAVLGHSPQALGLFTSVIAAGSICGGVVLQQNSTWLSTRPGVLMGSSVLLTALSQIGMALSQNHRGPWSQPFELMMAFLLGAGTATLLSGVNLMAQVGAPMGLRGRMAGLGQIAFLGGGGFSGLLAAGLTRTIGMVTTIGLLGSLGLALALGELARRGGMRLRSAEYP